MPMKIGDHKKAIIDKLSEEDIKYLKSLPTHVKLMDNWYAVHAGFNPKKSIEDQAGKELSYIRYVKDDGTPIEGTSPKGSNIHWAEKWTGQQNVVYGHFVHSLTTPKITRGVNGSKCYGLDT